MKKRVMLLMITFLVVGLLGCSKTGDKAENSDTVEHDASADVQEEATIKFPEFAATTLDGDAIDSSIFADADVTMVNIWGTFCGPCISEMPDLAELNGELPEGCALVGLLTDVYDGQNADLALQIVEETGVTYKNIIPDETLYQFLAENITGVPTTLYVDSEGNILGGVVGARSKDEYKAILEELVKE